MYVDEISLESLGEDHLKIRAALRAVLESYDDSYGRKAESPDPGQFLSAGETKAALRVLAEGGDPTEVVDRERVACALAAQAAAMLTAIDESLDAKEFVALAEAVGLGPELGLVAIAQHALYFITMEGCGLDGRCEDLRQAANTLERGLKGTGEVGLLEDWAPEAVRDASPEGGGEQLHLRDHARAERDRGEEAGYE